jgi:hypothetical protein
MCAERRLVNVVWMHPNLALITIITLSLIERNTLNSDALLIVGEAQYIGGITWLTSRLKGDTI